ncbi:MBL fold metallo-hydrolase [Alicyclobacillus sp. ALC3]|uniref:MBL fold metallo-hydrolase n=1 Tax=Alicyclobacillus sp. ALC3 TaxID=2796143 RepID=UPI002379D6E2|nr:MBL fold metallo-hydrolase [Alicyclobacillus sp. ALC3]WDL95776.1 MBL fold metallo-hydrolase [Alicyclobacillus sp. ALC3]
MEAGQKTLTVTVMGYWGTYPGPGEATTGFLVEHGDTKILLDCGSGVLAQLMHSCEVKDLSAVVVTHHHHDHVADLGVLTYAVLLSRLMKTRTQKLPVYMPHPGPDMKQSLGAEPLIDLHVVDEHATVAIGDVLVRFARTQHPVYCLAVRMEADGKVFVFSADSALDPESTGAGRPDLPDLARGADLFVCEASMYAGQEVDARGAGHMTAPQAGLLGRAAGVRRLALTHYPHYGDHRDLKAQAEMTYGGPVELLSTRQVLTV